MTRTKEKGWQPSDTRHAGPLGCLPPRNASVTRTSPRCPLCVERSSVPGDELSDHEARRQVGASRLPGQLGPAPHTRGSAGERGSPGRVTRTPVCRGARSRTGLRRVPRTARVHCLPELPAGRPERGARRPPPCGARGFLREHLPPSVCPSLCVPAHRVRPRRRGRGVGRAASDWPLALAGKRLQVL